MVAAAAVTVNRRLDVGLPSVEVVDITPVTTGDWLYSKKFSTVDAVFISSIGGTVGVDHLTWDQSSSTGAKIVFALAGTARHAVVQIFGRH